MSVIPNTAADPSGKGVPFNGELVPCGGGDPIPLLKAELTIGRAGSCDIALRYPNVSARHCRLSFREGYWHLQDLGSSNGIKVNGVRCDESFLHPGDEVQIAKHRYEIAYVADTSSPPPVEENPFAKSLMEKAGLERRPTKRPDRSAMTPGRPATRADDRSRPKAKESFGDDEDAAFEMLQ